MGHISLAQHEPRVDLVGVIEAIIHDPGRLSAFDARARHELNVAHHLPDTPIWDYLHWRRGLDPERFDFYHPQWKNLFAREAHWRHHHEPSGGSTVGPPACPPAAVPEPPGLGLMLIALGLLAMWRRGRPWA